MVRVSVYRVARLSARRDEPIAIGVLATSFAESGCSTVTLIPFGSS